jgi:tetratricopeptide (TPR) repeat protein
VIGISTFYLKGGQSLNFAVPASSLKKLMGRIHSDSKPQPFVDAIDQKENAVWQDEGFKSAVALFRKREYAQALPILNSVINRLPPNADVEFLLGGVQRNLGNIKEAAAAYARSAKLEPSNFKTWIFLAGCLELLGKHSDAIEAYTAAAKMNPKDATLWFELGVVAEHTQDSAQAAQFFRRACDLNPDYWLAWDRLAACFVRQKQYEAAAKAYEQVVRIAPKRMAGWYRLGECYWRLGEIDDMISAFQRVVSLDPTISGAWSFLGHGYNWKGDDAKALEILEIGVQRAHPDPQLWEDLAEMYQKRGRIPDADRALAQAKMVRSTQAKIQPKSVPRAVAEQVSQFLSTYVSSRNDADPSSELSYFAPEVILGDKGSVPREVVLAAIKMRRVKSPSRRYRLNRIQSSVHEPFLNLTMIKALIDFSDAGDGKKISGTANVTLALSEEHDRLAITLFREEAVQTPP